MIIPIFIMNRGCPNRCVYCNQCRTAGDYPGRMARDAFREEVHRWLNYARRKSDPVEIAFYGGNFTGMDPGDQEELLGMACEFVDQGAVRGIRVSTRPDALGEEALALLLRYGVGTVEVGAQSLDDDILERSLRGHTAADVVRTVAVLKSHGIRTGLHLMVGLPGDSPERFAFTVDRTVTLHPDMVRLHPTLVLQDTILAQAYLRGEYRPLGMKGAVAACKFALMRFERAGIPVIRMGLQTTGELEKAGSILAGPFHPAFRSLVEASIFFDMASFLIEEASAGGGEVTFFLAPKDVSAFRGQRNANVQCLRRAYALASLSILAEPAQERGSVVMTADGRRWRLDRRAVRERDIPAWWEKEEGREEGNVSVSPLPCRR
ncbi:MAG: radical SAM protein [Deltaproteobacteria bacterium]|nr:radical SAM protein [Deltaproteobacteria bacterium]